MPEFNHLKILRDIIIVHPQRFADARGYFCETYNAKAFADAGITDTFVQDNHSLSIAKGTIRGLHFQTAPHAQAKMVRCAQGRFLDVIVDIRPGSQTFGRHEQLEICADSGKQIYIPAGFAHGFCTLEDDTEIAYKVADFYSPAHDAGIKLDDEDLGIDWPFEARERIVSDKDLALPSFAAFCRENGVQSSGVAS